MKFTIKALGLGRRSAQRFEEALAEFRREGGARLPFDPDATRARRQAPDWTPAEPPTLQAVGRRGEHAGDRSRASCRARVRLQPLPDTYVRWMRSNVSRQKQAGYCHVTVRLPLGDFTAGQMRVLADLAEAYGDGTMRLTVEQNVLYRWVKTDSVEPFYQRLAAAGLGAPDAGTLERRRQLPRRGELPSGGDAVARSRPRADRAPQRAARSRRPGAVGQHQDQRLPERLRTASHRLDRLPGQRAQGRGAAPCRSTSCWSAAAARTKASRTSARWSRRCRCTG